LKGREADRKREMLGRRQETPSAVSCPASQRSRPAKLGQPKWQLQPRRCGTWSAIVQQTSFARTASSFPFSLPTPNATSGKCHAAAGCVSVWRLVNRTGQENEHAIVYPAASIADWTTISCNSQTSYRMAVARLGLDENAKCAAVPGFRFR
jgi:hypothetical protein